MATTFVANAAYPRQVEYSKECIRWFLTLSVPVVYQARILWSNIKFMQKKFQLRLGTKYAKVEILENGWAKLNGLLNQANEQVKSQQMSSFIRGFVLVPREIRQRVLLEFLRCCHVTHSIASL